MKLSSKIKQQISRIAGTYSGNDAAVDEMNAILLQLTMALMMIFLIAFSLFRLKTTEELEPVAKIKEEQQLNFQRQELISALERTVDYYNIRYGLKSFAKLNNQDMVVYDVGELIVNGKLADNQALKNAFINGAKASFEDYSNPDVLPQKWFARVMMEASIDENTVQPGNAKWLEDQIKMKIKQVRSDVAGLQYQSAAYVQTYLAKHPEEVTDAGVKSLLEQYIVSPPETQKILLNELDNSLKNYAFQYLKTQADVALMRDIVRD